MDQLSTTPILNSTASTASGAVPLPPKVKITVVRVSNYRSLKNVEISLEDLTILIGANNAGKTSFLDALHAAIGAGRKVLTAEEIRLAAGEASPPKSRSIVIDIQIRMTSAEGLPLDVFPAGSYWTSLWGTGIVQDPLDNFREWVGIRTTLAWSVGKAEYCATREFLKEWNPFISWLTAKADKNVTAEMLEPIALHYIDAKRDLDDDIRRQGSFWRKMTEDLGLTDQEIASVESDLSNLNEQIIGRSQVLQHVKTHLSDVQKVMCADTSGVEITPITRTLRDMAKGIDVNFSTSGGQSFPLTRHGMGTRSLASLLVFRAFASWREQQALLNGGNVHTLLALEEPEAHLHPQAQRSLFSQVKSIPGQRIVSTHSPYFAGQSDLSSLRLFFKRAGDTTVTQLDLTQIQPDDLRKLQTTVIQSRGDLLFARAVIFFEGQTEEQALPLWAEKFWGATVHELGFSFVCVGGVDYYPFIWMARSLGIPWYIFADGEPKPLAELEKALARLGSPPALACPNVLVLPNGHNFETQLLADGYLAEIEKALATAFSKPGYLDDYIAELHGSKGKNGVIRDYSPPNGRSRAALNALSNAKTRTAKPLANTICAIPDKARQIPPKLCDFFATISQDHGLIKAVSQ